VSAVEEFVARLSRAQERLDALEAQERPLVLRGWRDDFLGRTWHEQYDVTDVVGAGSSITLLDAAHGGHLSLRSGAGVGRYARIWLGAFAGGYNTLDADEGWTQIARIQYQFALTNVIYMIGANITPALNRYIRVGVDTNIGANYILQCNDGVLSTTDSGVAADGAWHVHRLEAYPDPVAGGCRVDYFLDGALIAYQTANVPTEVLTPFGFTYSRAANVRRSDWDYWDVIPGNLA